jgi:glutamate-1-semialdehyde 2,1-aminomutase
MHHTDIPTSPSQAIIEHAQHYIPGGVSSANRLVEPNLVFARAQGAYLFDAEGRRYIDYHAAFGPPLLGHCNPEVNQRVAEVMAQVDVVGIGPSELEARLAEKINQHVPSAEKVLFCNSGSEATYAALRLARAVTGRHKIIKFQGCYHGWHDAILMNVISHESTPIYSAGYGTDVCSLSRGQNFCRFLIINQAYRPKTAQAAPGQGCGAKRSTRKA